jgi:hypothetical protein
MDKTQQFIEKAKLRHGDKYDYSKVVYINGHKPVIIICRTHGEFEQSPNCHVNRGAGCSTCNRKPNTAKLLAEFLKKAKEIHGDTYSYDEVVYINCKKSVSIKCNTCGKSFKQTPEVHINGGGCRCNRVALFHVTSLETFIQKSREKHGDKYDYFKVDFINGHTKVTITCRDHGDFEQIPQDHYQRGSGCIGCSGRKQSTTSEFIEKARKVHGDHYDYSKVEYVTSIINVTIICSIHRREFQQSPSSHLQGRGCYDCSKKKATSKITSTKEEFIAKAQTVHGNMYTYDNVDYVNNSTNILITCKNHGDFKQTPQNHLAGKGCSRCMKNNCSKQQIQWLDYIAERDSIKIEHGKNGGEFKIGRYHVDGYCRETNTVFEYNGSVFLVSINQMTFIH